jgi:hypothetical protein
MTRWTPLFPVILSGAMGGTLAWLVLSGGSSHVGRLGGETWAVRCTSYGVSFERYARGASRYRAGWSLLDPMQPRVRHGLFYENTFGGGSRSDRLYVSFPWLIGFTVIPGAIWAVVAFRRPRRRVVGVCSNCEYDIRATPQRCPECGLLLRPPSPLDRILAFDIVWIWNRVWRGRSQFREVTSQRSSDTPMDAPAAPAEGAALPGADEA